MRLVILGMLALIVGCDPVDKSSSTKPNSSSQRSRPLPEEKNPSSTREPISKQGDSEKPPEKKTGEADPITVLKTDPNTEEKEKKEDPPEEAPPIPESFKPLNKNKNIFFEKFGETRRVHLLAQVCLREGPLEVLLCKLNSKEHESIMNIDADAREIHLALIAAGAQPGTPVKFLPKYESATGTKVKVSLTYREKGKLKTVTAQEWIKDKKTGKDMPHDWVFAGSKFFKDPERPNAPPYYMANNGEIISLANFPDSMMDLPVKSPKEALDLIYEINTAKIPPLKTPVLITFEPVLPKK